MSKLMILCSSSAHLSLCYLVSDNSTKLFNDLKLDVSAKSQLLLILFYSCFYLRDNSQLFMVDISMYLFFLVMNNVLTLLFFDNLLIINLQFLKYCFLIAKLYRILTQELHFNHPRKRLKHYLFFNLHFLFVYMHFFY